MKTKYGGKIKVDIPDDIDRVAAISAKHGQTMWLKVKTRLHKDYLRYKNDEERLSHRPEDVSVVDWKYLAVSARNKLNRQKQTTKHSCGSKSFAEVEESTVKLLLTLSSVPQCLN
ncbi:hypothetical protein HAX54_025999 [Datura stramonium]|uniref:Uncharacterized protein n=1 Tax=Datura stramonium TaxID=4076 RepID=A0ABS8S7A7_DATST|nr:hypothetical protein [Datura stramonium]